MCFDLCRCSLLQFDPNGYLWALIHLICVGKSFSFGKRIRKSKCVGENSFTVKLVLFKVPDVRNVERMKKLSKYKKVNSFYSVHVENNNRIN